MNFFNRLTAVVLAAALMGPVMPLQARTRKGDKALNQGRAFEAKKDWDAALDAYERALAEDSADTAYQMAATKARYQAGQAHLENGLKIRSQGMLGEALLEFQRAFAVNPASTDAMQQIQLTQQMIERERLRVLQTGKESSPDERGRTPSEEARKERDDRLDRMLPVPELKPLGRGRIDIKINNQTPKSLFETVANYAGINIIFDSDYTGGGGVPQTPRSVVFQDTTLESALDYLAALTRSYWKPLSQNTIFVMADTQQKRRDLGSQVLKIFYLTNTTAPQELTDISNAVRAVTMVNNIFPYPAQNALVVRGDTDAVAVIEKIIADLDRPRSEVVVDVVVMETSSVYSRQLAAALSPINSPVSFTPRPGLGIVQDTSNSSNSNSQSSGTTSGSNTTTKTSSAVALSNIGRISSADWSTVLPGALLEAVMSDARTKVVQRPQLRSLDGVKATLQIGERVPIAQGSFQPGVGGVVNPLVNTQFQYVPVGVNVDIQPRVHESGEVSLHVELEISSVTGYTDIGGISQPIFGQRKVSHDIRLKEGEVNLLGGLIKQQEDNTTSGIPGLSKIPLLRRLFTSEDVKRQRSDLMIALTPRIVRRPVFTAENLKAVEIGTQQNIKVNYAPPEQEAAQAPAAAQQPAAAAPGISATPPATAPSATPAQPAAPAAAAPAETAPPAMAPPATAPPANTPPATAPPGARPQGAAPNLMGGPAAPGAPLVPASSSFQPAKIQAAVNGTFNVSLMLDRGVDVASASPMQIQYDPKLLNLVDVTMGDLFAKTDSPVFARNIMNDMGLANIQLSTKQGAAGVTGAGPMLNLRFQALAPGTTTITGLNVTLRNSQGLAVGSGSPQVAVEIK